jgi:predicted dehydrogenase
VAKLRGALPLGGPVELVVELICPSSGWAAHEVRDELLLDLGPHAIDLARYFGGADPVRVRGSGDERSAELELDLGGGRHAVLRLAHVGRYRELFAARTPGGRVARVRKGGLFAVPRRQPLVHSLARQLEAFAAAVGGSPPPGLGTADDAVAVMATVDAARLALAAGGAWQPVAAPALATAG